jgi:glutathione reductase (NADPH)
VLAGAAEVNERSRGIRGKGVSGDLLIDWNDLMRFKRSITDPVPVNHEAMYIKQGITLYHGHTRFTGPNSLQIGNSSVIARFIRIATGAVPRTLGIPGEEYLNQVTTFLRSTGSLNGSCLLAAGLSLSSLGISQRVPEQMSLFFTGAGRC